MNEAGNGAANPERLPMYREFAYYLFACAFPEKPVLINWLSLYRRIWDGLLSPYGLDDEEQATDRAFRIGQSRDVQVHKFVTLGTLEERIDEMLECKMGLSKQIVEGGEGWITELSTEELKSLLALSAEWIDKG